MSEPEPDPDAAMAEILKAQGELHAGIHDLLNILAMLRAEMDLAIDHAREQLAVFYRRFPNL
jgi:hypothetical protein